MDNGHLDEMAAPSTASSTKELKFLAVARRGDKTVLASRVHTTDKSYDYLGKVNQVMGSPGWQTVTTDRLSLEDVGYMFYVLIDEARGAAAAGGGGARPPSPTSGRRPAVTHPALARPPL